MDISPIVDSLNDEQRAAVTAELGHLRILAGAGSGKTRVLTHRIAWLVKVEHFSPFNILAVTFTNKAAHEMLHRIQGLLGMPANNMWVGTFHGLSHRLLRSHWQEANLPQNFQILDSDDQYRLVRRIMRDSGIDEAKWPAKQVQWYIGSQKEEGLRASQVAKPYDEFQRVMLKLYQQYENICQQSGLVDFSELLLRTYELLRDREDIREHYQKRFCQILVDEFQDTNQLQYAWLRLLAGNRNNVMIVGDDDQSIYSWRGAQIENMHRFERDYSNSTTIRLEQNYRSSGNILKAANQLISHNADRLGKNLWTSGSMGESIGIYAAYNEFDEARFVVGKAKEWRQQGNKLNQCAILYRSNAQSRILEEALLQEGLPYRIYGGMRFYERAEIKDVLAYLRLIQHPHDDTAFERAINTPTRGIGDRSLLTIRETALKNSQSLWQASEEIVEKMLLPNRSLNPLKQFLSLILEMKQNVEGMDLHEQIAWVIQQSGLVAYYEKEKGEKGRNRIENLEELVTAAQQFTPEDEELPALTAFLTHAALEAGETQTDAYADGVQMMTLHAAKGLEFPMVFMVGMEEGIFPHQMCLDEINGLAEERRLCYVGMTRAMQKLYMCYAESRYWHGKEKIQAPSRFLSELPAECLQEVRMRSKITIPVSQRASKVSFDEYSQEQIGFSLGQAVRHGKFGEGVIINLEGNGSKARVQVNFPEHGCKWLMLEYAGLEAI